jgi:hypothetical protein
MVLRRDIQPRRNHRILLMHLAMHYASGGGGAGVRPWRRMISIILALSGGAPSAALITAATSRKYSGPIAAGVMTQRAFTSSLARGWPRHPIVGIRDPEGTYSWSN